MDSHSVDRDNPTATRLSDAGTATYRSPRNLAKLVTGAFVLDLAATVVSVVLLWDALAAAHALVAGETVSAATFEELQQRGDELQAISWVLLAVCALVFGMWTYRVAKNVEALGGHLSVSPGWAVGYYFVPIVSLWRPYTILAEVWDASDPDPRIESYAPRSHALLLAWWLAWLMTSVAGRVLMRSKDPHDAQEWASQITMSLFSNAIDAVAVALALVMVWSLTGRQDARHAAMMPAARIA